MYIIMLTTLHCIVREIIFIKEQHLLRNYEEVRIDNQGSSSSITFALHVEEQGARLDFHQFLQVYSISCSILVILNPTSIGSN